MPTYDYECPEGHRFEVFQKMSDEPVTECRECGAPAVRKISGGAGFLFKGEGFYITDSRSEDYKKKASAEAPEPKKPASTPSESKGEGGGGTEASEPKGSSTSSDS